MCQLCIDIKVADIILALLFFNIFCLVSTFIYNLISMKFNLIHLFCRILAKIDDDMLKHYCNEDLFILEITTSTEEGMYDVTLKELFDT